MTMTKTDLAADLSRPIKDALTRLGAGAAADIEAFSAALSQDAAGAAAVGDTAALDHIRAQLRALGEAQRLDVAAEGWALIGGILEGASGLLVGLINRGLVEVTE